MEVAPKKARERRETAAKDTRVERWTEDSGNAALMGCELPPDEALAIPQVPGSLDKVLDNLETDHDFLVEGGVFTPDLIETWITLKRENEIDPLRLRPHPFEFALYYDV